MVDAKLLISLGYIVKFVLVNGVDLKIAFWTEAVQKTINDDIGKAIREIRTFLPNVEIRDYILTRSRNDDDLDDNFDDDGDTIQFEIFCNMLSTEGVSMVIDFTYEYWQQGIDFVMSHGIPYLRMDRTISPFLRMFGKFIQRKEGNDVVLFFQSDQDLMEATYHMIDGYPFRTMVLNIIEDKNLTQRVLELRPSPSYYGVFAESSAMNYIFEKMVKDKLFARHPEWHFVFLDANDRIFKYNDRVRFATQFVMRSKGLCNALEMSETYCTSGFKFQRAFIFSVLRTVAEMKHVNKNWLVPKKMNCFETNEPIDSTKFDIMEHLNMNGFLNLTISDTYMTDIEELSTITYSINVTIRTFSNKSEAVTDHAAWQANELLLMNETIDPAKRFFRISIAEAVPWTYQRRHPQTNELMYDSDGKPLWEGFCIDMIVAMADRLNFDYELILPKTGKFGERDPKTGRWDGVMGDLVNGETDFAVAALKMYAEREEVIDFVAPYFESTGISIVMRKPIRKTSLFKFMTVLRVEVWLSIVASLFATSLMLWLLDRYSPYSYRNNRDAYSQACREFTLRESFWFALTSFTPQGGGEAPKAVSGRILVAAYWLFVVLMLATFTANLAAFLTVERMQTPVQSLEQLARQSRINYTVVAESDVHQYFINMQFAEDTLYRLWKEMALNASPDYHKFRVWDYPIKEQYAHILLAINGSDPVTNASEGFRRVNEATEADFAFIHDSSEIKYEIINNCNLTEVGEVFAEQPYAIAIQQGSHLVDEFSFVLLELQKDRFLEDLKEKYWNQTVLRRCAQDGDQGGITLQSLGGVFIATLCGLGIAMITLAIEVFYYKKREKQNQHWTTEIRKVVPISDSESRNKKTIHVWNTSTDPPRQNFLKVTPSPDFEAAISRSQKPITPQSVTLGGAEFKPRQQKQIGLNLKRKGGKTKVFLNEGSDLPPYME